VHVEDEFGGLIPEIERLDSIDSLLPVELGSAVRIV
jgi:hypothetical protein